jgi:H+/gluconate symporter-like permease
MTNAVLTMTDLGTNAHAAPIIGTVVGIFGLIVTIAYATLIAKHETKKGNGYVISGTDKAEDANDAGKKLPPFITSVLPLLLVVVIMFAFRDILPTVQCIILALICATVLCIAFNFKALQGNLLKTFTDGWWSSVTPMLFMGGVMGFGGIVQNAPAFQHFINFAEGISHTFNPYLSAAIAVNVVAAIVGTALGGIQIFASAMLPSYLGMDINPEAMHRIVVLGSTGIDTLPHNATFITMCVICGVKIKEAYFHVFAINVVLPLIMTGIAIVMALNGII